MIFCYMDEAGNTGQNIDDPAQPFHFVGGLLVPEDGWLKVTESMRKIALDALGKRVATRPGFMFHGRELFSNNGVWRGMPKKDRLDVLESCLKLVGENRCRFVYGKCNKVRLQQYVYPMHPHSVAFWLCMERAASFASNRRSLVSLIAATDRAGLSRVAQDFLRDYRQTGAPFGRTVGVSHVVDCLHFIPSNESSHLQLCDLCLWVIQRVQTHDPIEEDIEELFDVLSPHFSGVGSFPY